MHSTTLRILRFSLLLGLVADAVLSQNRVPEIRINRDDLVITSDVKIKKDVYRVRDRNGNGVVILRGEDITVDFQGATLIGAGENTGADAFEGFGICIRKGRNIVLRNAVVRGFKVAIAAFGSQNLAVQGCTTSFNFRQRLKSTPEREDGSDWLWPHKNDKGEWMKQYGGGIALTRCTTSTVAGNTGHHGQNGILLSSCTGCRIHDNDFSCNSGWGLGMWRSSRNVVSHNRFDWCVRGYSHKVYARGQDSAGILVFEQCCENVFAYNSATHGGDGFFLYAGHETTRRTGKGGCNRNLLYRNDFSHAVANGIEATFSDGNRFIENILLDSNYGVWGGYSYNTIIVGNRIEDNSTSGVAIEHGTNTLIEGNAFKGNACAVQLWWDQDKEFLEGVYGKKRDTASAGYTLARNTFQGDRTGVEVRDSHRITIRENEFKSVPRVLRLLGSDNSGVVVEKNNIYRADADPFLLVENRTKKTQAVGENHLDVPANQLESLVTASGGGCVVLGTPLKAPVDIQFKNLTHREEPPQVPGHLDAFLPEGSRRGRACILVDEWGPFDFKEVKLFPSEVTAWNKAVFHLLGPEVSFEIGAVSRGVTIVPAQGTVPARLEVTLTEGGLDLRPFTFQVKTPGRDALSAAGVLARAEWNVRFYSWKRGKGEGAKDPPGGTGKSAEKRGWKRILSSRPLEEIKCDTLDFNWGGGGPHRKTRDYFATDARTRIRLPAGTYRITTVSDDGIRVRVGGKVIIDDWSHHPPKRHTAVIRLHGGDHRIRVEHFEITGHAQLQLWLKREAAKK